MKRIVFMTAVLMCSSVLAGAQEQQKPEVKYIPEAGEFSIGFDASPIFKYVGNLFNASGNNSFEGFKGQPFTAGYLDGQNNIMPDVSIMGKYMLTDNWALKANIGLMLVGNKHREYVRDDAAAVNDPLAQKEVIDVMTTARTGVSVMLGGEYRLGTGRIQGVFGAGLLFALQSNSNSYKYGNAITAVNTKPTISDENLWNGSYRPLKTNTDGVNTYLGLTASAGVEWFVAPKISLGAEVNLSAYGMFGAQAYTKSEGYNAALGSVEQRTDLASPGDIALCLGTESLGGALYISFWF